MDQLTEYFVRHYTLIIDNDQQMYWPAVARAKHVLRESGVTLAEYTAMSDQERADRFAMEIGDRLITLIQAWCEEATTDRNHPGMQLFNEVMLYDSDVQFHLGAHYLPEVSEAAEYLPAPCDHVWVAGMLYVSDEDVAEVAKSRTVECEKCETVWSETDNAAL